MIAALPMMKPLSSSSAQVRETPPDMIGSNARKRRREILQSNRAAKTSFTGESIPNPPLDSNKKMRSGNASLDKVRHTHASYSSTIHPDSQNNEDVMSSSIVFTDITTLNTTIPTVTANSKMPNYCGSLSEFPTSNVAPIKTSKKTKVTNIKQASKATSQSTKPAESPDSTSKKKPQMRYDPSVPMTKEAAAIWRREQRRKRNRDSAAASRQRQRNRITELEEEVSEWKKKYDDAILQLSKQEDELKRFTLMEQNSTTSNSISDNTPEFAPRVSKSPTEDIGSNSCDKTKPAMVFEDENYTAVSPCLTPSLIPHPSNASPDFVSLSLSQALPIVRDSEDGEVYPRIKEEDQDEQQPTLGMTEANKEKNLIEMSRPAVTITGTFPSLASLTPGDKPDSIVIPTRSCLKLSPSMSPIDEQLESDTLPSLSLGAARKEIPDSMPCNDAINNDYVLDIMEFPSDEDDMELGNFLLDAADWL